MSESKYISVIHVPTDKIVTAFKFENDATWIGKEKDELIATANYCKPGSRVKMIFVKSFTRKDNIEIASYFRSAPNQSGLMENLSGESEEHKKAKENIYDGLYSGNIKINGKTLDKKEIDDIYIEYRSSRNGYIIPDILIKFKEKHIKYGYGIFIEIQLSRQHEEETLIRTYSRAIEGFSGIWLWRDGFDKDMNLINKDLEIRSHRKLLSELDNKIENNFINRINNYGQIIDKKLINSKTELWNTLNSYVQIFKEEIKNISHDKKIDLISIKDELEKLYKLKEDINIDYIKQDLEDIKLKYTRNFTDCITEEYNQAINITKKKLKEEIKNIIESNISKLKQFCPKCGSVMKIGKAMSGYNWYCSNFPIKCDGIIKEVNFNEN